MRHVISHLLGNFFIMQLSHEDIQMKEVFSENLRKMLDVRYELTILKDELYFQGMCIKVVLIIIFKWRR